MKKFLKDNTLEAQPIPEDLLRNWMSIPEEKIEEAKKERLLVIHNYKDNNYSVQIAFNTKQTYTNNTYYVLLFDLDDNLLHCSHYPSHTQYPPVWDRSLGYVDYFDFLMIQKHINKTLKFNNMAEMEYDLSVKSRAFYFVKGSKEIVEQLLSEEKPYEIIEAFAEKCPDLVKTSQKMAGFDV